MELTTCQSKGFKMHAFLFSKAATAFKTSRIFEFVVAADNNDNIFTLYSLSISMKLINNYPTRGRWIVVDICRDSKRRGIYLAVGSEPEGDSCFSIYHCWRCDFSLALASIFEYLTTKRG